MNHHHHHPSINSVTCVIGCHGTGHIGLQLKQTMITIVPHCPRVVIKCIAKSDSWCIWMTVTNQAQAPHPPQKRKKNGYNTITCPADVIVRTQVTRLGYCHTGRRKTSKEPVNTSSQSSSPFHQGVYHFPS